MSADAIIQGWILAFGLAGLVGVNLGWEAASLVGLVGQVGWIAFTWRTRAWGVGLLTAAYTVAWVCGVVRWLTH